MKIANLVPLLRGELDKEYFIFLCDTVTFIPKVVPLIKHMRWMKENDLEIDALSVRKTSKSREMLIMYMNVSNAVDREFYDIPKNKQTGLNEKQR